MRAYYYDDVPGDAREPHEATTPALADDALATLGVAHFSVPVLPVTPDEQLANPGLEPIARGRAYRNRDVITVSPASMGAAYEAKIRMFFEEHMHEDEEARYILDGSGFFDVRDASDARWVRIHVAKGDLLILPAGVYHRFTPDAADFIQAMRLFKDEPKWTPLNRGDDTDVNRHRVEYVAQRDKGFEVDAAA